MPLLHCTAAHEALGEACPARKHMAIAAVQARQTNTVVLESAIPALQRGDVGAEPGLSPHNYIQVCGGTPITITITITITIINIMIISIQQQQQQQRHCRTANQSVLIIIVIIIAALRV